MSGNDMVLSGMVFMGLVIGAIVFAIILAILIAKAVLWYDSLSNQEAKSVAEDYDRVLKVYQDHVKHLETQLEEKRKAFETVLKSNAEMKEQLRELSANNTYLRDRLNAEKKF